MALMGNYNEDISLEDEVNLALADAKRAGREVNSTVKGLARLRDRLQTEQSEEDTSYDQHRDRHS